MTVSSKLSHSLRASIPLRAEFTHRKWRAFPTYPMSDPQSNIPTKLITTPDVGGPSQGETLADSQIGAMLAARSRLPTRQSSHWQPLSAEELQGEFPHYEVCELLGRGGMSAVYRVRDGVLGREVALKVLRPELMNDDQAVEMFVNEARVTAQLDHPNIPAVYALESDKLRSSVFTMKVLEGQTLQQMLEANERKDEDGLSAAVEVILRICDVLAFAHSKGVLHLDLKPSNVIVAAFGQIYLVDWGIARRKAELPKGPGDMLNKEGTPSYMAPEQATGEHWKLDERTDIFALGGLLYRVLCGRPPHTGATPEEALAQAEKGDVTSPDVAATRKGQPLPRQIVSICVKALDADPAQRYQNVQEFQRDLERFARGLTQLPQLTFRAGEAIVTEGESGDAAYVIVSGDCMATRLVGDQPQTLRLLKAGDMFGEAAVFIGQPRSATVRAITDTVVGVVEQAAMREEMERTSFMSLAVRTVTSTFLDLDQQLARHLRQSQVVELALRHVALHGEHGRTPWEPLLAKLVESSGASKADVSSWVLGAMDVSLDGESVVLRG